jgi:hypothetical protein
MDHALSSELGHANGAGPTQRATFGGRAATGNEDRATLAGTIEFGWSG